MVKNLERHKSKHKKNDLSLQTDKTLISTINFFSPVNLNEINKRNIVFD